ncbi:uncharacterized protein LOC143038612 [Oratosquilla oratoria]|uniref:uncharacterized protein LOC143038612 n=1 Tax=Oratosquilla oratoria TaxID=337810 RepID=UPI003F75CA54
MAFVSVHPSEEAAMSHELEIFWSSIGRKFETRSMAPSAFRVNTDSNDPSEATWKALVNADSQRSTPTKAVEEETQPGLESYQLEQDVEEEELLHENLLDDLGACCLKCDEEQVMTLDGSRIGDVPAQYVMQGLRSYELPVIGTYVDSSIVPGFCYSVRQAQSKRSLFQGRALLLLSVGMGYGKRLTFQGDSCLTNDNFFWSDTNPEGYGFSLVLVQPKDAFAVLDANNEPIATASVVKLIGPQRETSHRVKENGDVEKRARVSMLCRLTYFDETRVSRKPLSLVVGECVAVKPKGKQGAAVSKVVNCSLDGERGYTLSTQVNLRERTTIVSGQKYGDVPTKYTITGLQSHEIPVIGTYVDPRIVPGFQYRVRPVDSNKPMFGGSALLLQSVGRGYGKRLTFASSSHNHNDNYFWSDTHPEGYGFSIEVLAAGDSFRIEDKCGNDLGRAVVFRADAPQLEEDMEVTNNGHVIKRVRVTFTCDVNFNGEDSTVAVTGTAVATRRSRGGQASVTHIEDVAVSSQINILFRRCGTLRFIRE